MQGERQYNQESPKILRKIGITVDNVNTCLNTKKKGIVYVAPYIDYNLLVGNLVAIDETVKLL